MGPSTRPGLLASKQDLVMVETWLAVILEAVGEDFSAGVLFYQGIPSPLICYYFCN